MSVSKHSDFLILERVHHDTVVVQCRRVCHMVQGSQYKIASHRIKVVNRRKRKEEGYVSFY